VGGGHACLDAFVLLPGKRGLLQSEQAEHRHKQARHDDKEEWPIAASPECHGCTPTDKMNSSIRQVPPVAEPLLRLLRVLRSIGRSIWLVHATFILDVNSGHADAGSEIAAKVSGTA